MTREQLPLDRDAVIHKKKAGLAMDTPRLALRRFVPEDWEDLYEYLRDEEVVRFEPYPPATQEQCRELAARRARSEDFWAVLLPREGKLIGNIYLARREMDAFELGYVFHRAYQGKGYATEAAKALIGRAFREEGAHRVFAQCNPDNGPSWRLLERLGMRREGHLRKNVYFRTREDGRPLWQDTYLYGVLKEEWVVQ